MKIIKRIVYVALVLLFLMSTVSFAVTSYGYGDTIKMYAPDGRQAVIYTGDVPAWEAVGWFTSPVNSYITTSNPYYPSTNILSYEPYGMLVYQNSETLDDGSVDLHWGYETSISQADKYINELKKHGYYQESYENLYDYRVGNYISIQYKKDSSHAFNFQYYYDFDVAYVCYILY